MNHVMHYKTYLPKLIEMVVKGNLKPHVEIIPFGGSPSGLEAIFDGVDVSRGFLYTSRVGRLRIRCWVGLKQLYL